MKWSGRTPIQSCFFVLSSLLMGCTAYHSTAIGPIPPPAGVATNAFSSGSSTRSSMVRQVSLEVPSQDELPKSETKPEGNPFAEMNELSVDAVVEQVLARNPSLAQMTAAWEAASARYPQVTSLDDPMFGATIGPASIGSRDVDFAYRLEASQKIPFPGKLRLRGESALAEANAAGNEVDDMRLQLIESAKDAYFDYYMVVRAIAVNEESLKLLKSHRDEAQSRYEKALVPQQDIIQADVELSRQEERTLTLERMRKVAIARLNTLMHRLPDQPLPPPPEKLAPGLELPPVAVLRSKALAQRPDLQALANRIAAEEASLRLAQKEFLPDFEVMAAYDAFWQPEERDLRPMLGARVNVPIQKKRRYAAIIEAKAKIAQRRAELESRTDQVNLQVQEAYEQVLERERVVRLYENKILPRSQENVSAARSAYETGKVPFLSLLEAQRSQVELRDRYYEAFANYFRRRATLERVIGGPLPAAPMNPGSSRDGKSNSEIST